MFSYLKTHGVVDKDGSVAESKRRIKKGSRKRRKPRKTVNLHGLTSLEASVRIRIALEECRNKGIHEMLIIHGKGIHSDLETGPVLKTMVKNMLTVELCMEVRSFYSAAQNDGGDGATVVNLV